MATITPIRGSYVLQWSDATGRHTKTVGKVGILSAREANAILKAKEYELCSGKRILNLEPHSSAIQFETFTNEYLKWYATEYPSSYYRIEQLIRQHLVPFYRYTPLDLFTPKEAEQYKSERLQKASVGTVTKEIRTLQAILNKAVEWNDIHFNPLHRRVREPKQMVSNPEIFYSKDQLDQLYAVSKRANVWRWIANTGLRRMEALHAEWRNIGKDAMRVLSTEEQRTKSGKWREIPLAPGAIEALAALKSNGEGYVLPRIAPPSFSRAFANDAKAAGLPGSLHTLRHTFISHVVMIGTPLRVVQQLAGHANYKTTERYSHLSPGFLQDSVALLRL